MSCFSPTSRLVIDELAGTNVVMVYLRLQQFGDGAGVGTRPRIGLNFADKVSGGSNRDIVAEIIFTRAVIADSCIGVGGRADAVLAPFLFR